MNFKSLWLGSNTSLLIKTETITINTFLPKRNKFVYFCSVKIHASGFSELLESIFCLLLVVEALFLQKVVEMLEEVVVGWQEARWMWRLRQNFVAQFVWLLKQVRRGKTARSWFLITFSKNRPRFLREMPDCRTGAENTQDDPEAFQSNQKIKQ